MPADLLNEALAQADFPSLFLELGWNASSGTRPFTVTLPSSPAGGEGKTFQFREAAQLGPRVWICRTPAFPGSAERAALDAKLRRRGDTYLAVFVDSSSPRRQLWMVPVRAVDRRRLVSHETADAAASPFLREKLERLRFPVGSPPGAVEAIDRLEKTFLANSERVTKRFYALFREHHKAFAKALQGLDAAADRERYASVMLDRLMFCYFVQKKGFLDQDPDYLSRKLAETRRLRGENRFHGTFYKRFLRALFADGLNTPVVRRTAAFVRTFGRIPYLNGGLFDLHAIERANAGIDLPDSVFEELFAFFDQWHWHLDDTATGDERDINPDVLGYIFEQYINDRAQMGAYYTKEDITDYIGRNCIVPWLLDAVAAKDPAAFKPRGYVWRTLAESGDRFIFPAMLKGVYDPLPDYVERGIDPAAPGLHARRARWNEPADPALALPTEIWRETVDRRRRCAEIRNKIASGAIHDVRDLVSLNLDVRAFAEDLVAKAPDHLFVRHVYEALRSVTVLDPTCGSGAFLFAAMNILEPLYERCLDRMEEFNANNPRLFREELAELRDAFRSNRRHFIYKSIILRNLYGVDIMSEAVEIAKLRLFLKMVAVVDADFSRPDDNFGLDPLPDIDFNIRCGNTLVGYASPVAVHDAIVPPDRLAINEDDYEEIKKKAEDVSDVFSRFRALQLGDGDTTDFKDCKKALRKKLDALNNLLDITLASISYAMGGESFPEWKASHQPFHWYSEFYDIVVGRGGFDVIIGNPPYVEYSDVEDYKVRGFKTEECGDLYAMVMERAYALLKKGSSFGMIVPISIFGVDGFKPLQELSCKCLSHIWNSSYANRPSQLFDAQKRLSIVLGIKRGEGDKTPVRFFTGPYYRWKKEEFPALFFARIGFIENEKPCTVFPASFEKFGSEIEQRIFKKILSIQDRVGALESRIGQFQVYYTRKFNYFLAFLDFVPEIRTIRGNELVPPSELKTLLFDTQEKRMLVLCALSSSAFFWFWNALSDCRNMNRRDVLAFPVPVTAGQEALVIGKKYMDALKATAYTMQKSGLWIQTFHYSRTKPILDEIDELLSKHYGFTQEELDFIVNYDIKYRMGDELGGGGE